MYIDSLLQQKDLLLHQMKDLLLVNDNYNLQKIKKEYDIIISRIEKLKLGKIKTNYLHSNTGNIGSDNYSCFSFKSRINPNHAKYIKAFKNPVTDYNFLLLNKQRDPQSEPEIGEIEEPKVEINKADKTILSGFNGVNGDGLKIKDVEESEHFNEMEYTNESDFGNTGYSDYTNNYTDY
jgi:hypothetical protein